MGYDMYWETDGDDRDAYFRVNIFGMGSVRQALQDAGALHWHSEHPPWPASEDAVIEAEIDEVLAWQDRNATGIAGWKLCSNDGWHVTPEECRQAKEAWDKNGDDTNEYVNEFAIWIGKAADHGGFRVN